MDYSYSEIFLYKDGVLITALTVCMNGHRKNSKQVKVSLQLHKLSLMNHAEERWRVAHC